MQLFNKLPGFQRGNPGMERMVLRRIPAVLTVGLAVLILPSLMLRLTGQIGWHSGALVSMIDIYAMGAVLLYCNVVFLVGMAALIVMLMKGPAYAADAYALPDSDSPSRPVYQRWENHPDAPSVGRQSTRRRRQD